MIKKKILIDAVFKNETRAVLINSDNNYIEEIEYQTANKQQTKANIYLAKVIRIERSLQAAFIDYGSGKNGFLSFNEIHPDYYNLPTSNNKNNNSLIDLKAITPLDIASVDSSVDLEEESKILDSINSKNLFGDSSSKYLGRESEIEEINVEIDENEVDKLEGETSKNNENPLQKQFKLEDVIKKGQVLLVQVQKEERGNKGASFTTYISLAGKYCVLMPNKADQNGISRRISNPDERKRLKNIIAQLTIHQDNSAASIIVRTAGVGRTSYEIKKDYDYLVRLWNRIREVTLNSSAPAFIHMEEDIIQKIIRDLFDHNIDELLIQGHEAFSAAADFMQNILPHDSHKVKEYIDKVPIFTKFGIEEQLGILYQPIATLPAGGYVVINPTEALISVDVNSGKSTSEKNIEETALKTNIEAAKEFARQAKLRDLSGLIVIDFIDMNEIKHRRIVERTLREAFIRDRARIQIGIISPFGLLEMSRQRLRPSFTEANSVICSHCNGKGIIRADESNAMLIFRTIENEVFKGEYDKVNVFTTLPSILYILNHKRAEIAIIEEKYSIKLGFFNDIKATSDSFSIEKVKLASTNTLNKKQIQSALVSNTDLYDVNDIKNVNSKRNKWKTANETPTHTENFDDKNLTPAPTNEELQEKNKNKNRKPHIMSEGRNQGQKNNKHNPNRISSNSLPKEVVLVENIPGQIISDTKSDYIEPIITDNKLEYRKNDHLPENTIEGPKEILNDDSKNKVISEQAIETLAPQDNDISDADNIGNLIETPENNPSNKKRINRKPTHLNNFGEPKRKKNNYRFKKNNKNADTDEQPPSFIKGLLDKISN